MQKIISAAVLSLSAVTASASAEPPEAPQAPTNGTTKVFGEVRILMPSSFQWTYTSVPGYLTSFHLNSAGWFSSGHSWQSYRAPDGTTWLARMNGLYIDYAIPLPGGMN